MSENPLPVSPDFRVRVHGQEIPVFHTPVASYALVRFERPMTIAIDVLFSFERAIVRPLRHKIALRMDGTFTFDVDRPMHLSIELDDRLRQPLFLFIDEPVAKPPAGARVFGPGVHDIGATALAAGDHVHLDAGAVVRGAFYADDAANIRITGNGILDGSTFPRGGGAKPHMLTFRACSDVHVEGITIIGAPWWTVVPRQSQRVTFRNVKLVSWADSDDGFDIVGCKDVLIDRCFARTKDDCVAIKAIAWHAADRGLGQTDVERVVVQGCTFWNAEWGNALEIGYETRCGVMRDITFRDIDIIRSEPERWTSGGVLTIHNGDRAIAEDVLYEDIRIEDAGHKLIDLKITLDKYSKDEQRGQIRRITFKDIAIVDGGFAPSIMQGYGPDNIVRDITIENLTYRGQRATTLMDARFITERCSDVIVL
jgi:polygalacturonase